MFEQLAVFTASGQVIYQYNALGKKFAESQVNAFVNQLILNPINADNSTVGSNPGNKYHSTIITAESQAPQKSKARNFAVMYDILKQPTIYIVITYAEQNLQLNKEAIETLDLVSKLWHSLDLSTRINENINGNRPLTSGLADLLNKFNQYFTTKYEQSIKYVVSSTTDTPNFAVKASTKSNKSKSAKNNINNSSTNTGGGRKWGRNGIIEDISNIDSSALDFSTDNDSTLKSSMHERTPDSINININKDSFGNRTDNGDFLIKEIDDLLDDMDDTRDSELQDDLINGSSYLNNAVGYLKRHILGNKTIDENDLQIVLNKLKDKLVSKNVAPEVASYLTEQVKQDILGSKTENWTSVEKTAEKSLNKVLTQLLTPGASVDLLHEIQTKLSTNKGEPYVFSVVGVNGVGKSTNLSKLAFWLLQNNLKVLIVACDTFRSGAVEQLRVHVENLAQLMNEDHIRGSKNSRGKSGNDYVELFEAGYGGSDLVTKIAKQAIKYASDNEFDVVLMDTAGRRHNDPTLMSPLKSFAEQAKPDKIIMVGEALVGTDSVQQAKNFNDAFGKARNLDFFIISKCDTVGEMLGTMVNMVYATGIPILFVGVGQTYVDLRTLSVQWVVRTLLA